ncbi:SPOR domain-containing protein [Desulfobotulus sp. H1]|uniref:SPOR domain-containing protein n=1 Tax=Desulfobotulus pelophilus TaxID=2823377 RepID=A0ABT3N7F8_9BACT|nr:SPOR domain-containing protein [Desulfobotulus pelophilus]MCW7753106.1 SPOR domain-containing protein [Desulfobotulus pelophilus]
MTRISEGSEKKDPRNTGGAGQIWDSYVFVLMVGVFMFVLGLLVGRGTAPVTFDIPRVDARLQELFAGKGAQEPLQTPELAFFEALKHGEDMTTEDLPRKTLRFDGEKVPMPTDSLPVEPVERVSAPAFSAEPAPRTVRELSPEPKPEKRVSPQESRQPSPALGDGSYTIQIAAVKRPEDAARLVQRFRDLGYAAYAVTGSDDEGGVWYRVRVGRFSGREAAQPVLDRLQNEQVRGFVLRAE